MCKSFDLTTPTIVSVEASDSEGKGSPMYYGIPIEHQWKKKLLGSDFTGVVVTNLPVQPVQIVVFLSYILLFFSHESRTHIVRDPFDSSALFK